MIATRELRKTFAARGKGAAVEAVRGISFTVEKGEIFGLLGPNGAGKTTTMRMLCTLLPPSGGDVIVAGDHLPEYQSEVRKKIGYVSQAGGMQRESSGRENLILQAGLYGLSGDAASKRAQELIDLLQLGGFADRKTATYSGGQRRIFDLAAGLVHRPQLLFLDEPSTGLDPQNRAHVWDHVRNLRKEGTTVFLTTHYLDEADALCDRVAIVDNGMIVALGTPTELKKQISGDVINLGFETEAVAASALHTLRDLSFIRERQHKEDKIHIFVDLGEENLPVVITTLHQSGIPARSISLSRPSLDDVFLKLTGRSLRADEN
jgi:ABC-2 type transport system ATP-binding protein